MVAPQQFLVQLPGSFKSLYRLHLRTISASVLHHPTAVKNLRTIWRGRFDEAAKVYCRLVTLNGAGANENPQGSSVRAHDPSDAAMAREREGLEQWLTEWNKRIDNTLSLLHTSAHSRGLPHLLIRNFAFLQNSSVVNAQTVVKESRRIWQPNLPRDSTAYKVSPPSAKELKKEHRMKRWREFDERVWKDVEEVVKMAEGRDKLLLGKI